MKRFFVLFLVLCSFSLCSCEKAYIIESLTESNDIASSEDIISEEQTSKEELLEENSSQPSESIISMESDGKTSEDISESSSEVGEDISSSESIIDESSEISEEVKTSCVLDVKNIMQLPELPNGCEITSLTIVLNYLGFDVDKCYMSDNYLTQGPIGEVTPWEAFLGNPRENNSYGCYAPVIVNDANRFLRDMGSSLCAYDLSGSNFSDLFSEIDEGNPVIVWATIDLANSRELTSWYINGEKFTWRSPLHCMVLHGYDLEKNVVYIADPLVGNVIYDLDTFADRYIQMYSQALVIK